MPSFYPVLFASVAGLLEAFGVMVFERIRSRAEDPGEEATPPARGEVAMWEAHYGCGNGQTAQAINSSRCCSVCFAHCAGVPMHP